MNRKILINLYHNEKESGEALWVSAIFQHLQDARNKLFSFVDAVDVLNENTEQNFGNMQKYLLDLKVTVEYAFTNLNAICPADDNGNSNQLLPQVKNGVSGCDDLVDPLNHEKSEFLANATELLAVSDIHAFKYKYRDFNYRKFADTIIRFISHFTECISRFENYMNDFNKLIVSPINCTKTHVARGNEYIFEKESKVRHTQYVKQSMNPQGVVTHYMAHKEQRNKRMTDFLIVVKHSLFNGTYNALYDWCSTIITRLAIDGQVHIWKQDVCKHHDYLGWSAYTIWLRNMSP